METFRAQQSVLADELVSIQRQLEELRATGDSSDGLVTATVDGRGRVTGLDLDARIFRTPDSQRLADQILAAIGHAADDAAAQASRLAHRALGTGTARDSRVSDPAFDLPRHILGGRR